MVPARVSPALITRAPGSTAEEDTADRGPRQSPRGRPQGPAWLGPPTRHAPCCRGSRRPGGGTLSAQRSWENRASTPRLSSSSRPRATPATQRRGRRSPAGAAAAGAGHAGVWPRGRRILRAEPAEEAEGQLFLWRLPCALPSSAWKDSAGPRAQLPVCAHEARGDGGAERGGDRLLRSPGAATPSWTISPQPSWYLGRPRSSGCFYRPWEGRPPDTGAGGP